MNANPERSDSRGETAPRRATHGATHRWMIRVLVVSVAVLLCVGGLWYLVRLRAPSYGQSVRPDEMVPVPEQLLARAKADKTLAAKARTLYLAKCSQCHGLRGEGRIGPNLADDQWLYGGSLEQIYAVIVRGVPQKGMLAWGKLLAQDELVNLTAYVASLHGTRPSDAKAPQGKRAAQ